MPWVLSAMYIIGALCTILGAVGIVRTVLSVPGPGGGYASMGAFARSLNRRSTIWNFVFVLLGILTSTVASVWSLWI